MTTIGRFGRRSRGSIGRIGGCGIASGSGAGQEPINLKRKREFIKRESWGDMKLVTEESLKMMSRNLKIVAARADSQIRDPDWTEETSTPPSKNSD